VEGRTDEHGRDDDARRPAQGVFALKSRSIVCATFTAAVACAPSPMSTALELPRAPRRPDAVPVDVDRALPEAAERAPASGVVSLKQPIGDDVVRHAVDAFFAAFTRHDLDALDGMLSRSARLLDAHGGSTYGALREELRGRIHAFEAAGVGAPRVDAVERFDYRDLGGEGGARQRPGEMRPHDVLVFVHVDLPRSSASKLFAPIVVLLLRWEEDADRPGKSVLRVAGYDEQDEASPREPFGARPR
jgi:hypothetical protein